MQVKNDNDAHKLDLVWDSYLDKAAKITGCAGASRLLCKTEWDYKLIVKWEDSDSLKGYMAEHHESMMEEFMPSAEELAVGGKVHQQNFVCTPPGSALRASLAMQALHTHTQIHTLTQTP